MGRTVGSISDTEIPLQTAINDNQEPKTPRVDFLRRADFHIPNANGINMMYFLRHMEMLFCGDRFTSPTLGIRTARVLDRGCSTILVLPVGY